MQQTTQEMSQTDVTIGYCCVIETQRLISNNVDTAGKSEKLRNTEGQNGKFPLNYISAIYAFKIVSYLKYCFFVIHGYCKTFFVYAAVKGEKV